MKSALIVVDVQQSFTQRPYWREHDVPAFVEQVQGLVDRFHGRSLPVLQVFHVEEQDGPKSPFSLHSGLVATLPALRVNPTEVFYKSVHSAMFASNKEGQGLDYWLRRNGVGRLVVSGIRTEQCCETTTRHACDLGYAVSYAIDATLTFPMLSGSGRTVSPEEIKERTELVLAGRFAEVSRAEAIAV